MARQFGSFKPRRASYEARVALLIIFCLLMVFSAAALLVLNHVTGQDQSANATVTSEPDPLPQIEMVGVLIPTRKIEAGQPLDPLSFRREVRPKVGVSERAVHSVDEIRGFYARVPLMPGQLLTVDTLTTQRPINAITANIPEGYRAVTINTDMRSGVEGWARPGARVDIAWNSTVRGKQAVTIIVENAKVLSAQRQIEGQQQPENVDPNAPAVGNVTLLMPIADANKILLAQSTGQLSLSLRGDRDASRGGNSATITVDDLIGGAQAVEQRPDTIVRVRNKDGSYEELSLKNGRLVPFVQK